MTLLGIIVKTEKLIIILRASKEIRNRDDKKKKKKLYVNTAKTIFDTIRKNDCGWKEKRAAEEIRIHFWKSYRVWRILKWLEFLKWLPQFTNYVENAIRKRLIWSFWLRIFWTNIYVEKKLKQSHHSKTRTFIVLFRI